MDFLGLVRQTDNGIFLCVPCPNHVYGIFIEGLSPGTLEEFQSASLKSSDTATSDGGNTPWIEVIGAGNRKKVRWDSSTTQGVERTNRKARRSTSRRGQR